MTFSKFVSAAWDVLTLWSAITVFNSIVAFFLWSWLFYDHAKRNDTGGAGMAAMVAIVYVAPLYGVVSGAIISTVVTPLYYLWTWFTK